MSARSQLAAHLEKALNASLFRVVPTERTPPKLTKATVVVRHRDYTPAPNAQGAMFAGLVVTLLSHHEDFEKAEDHLDERFPDLVEAINGIDGLTWTRAQKGKEPESPYLGFDISVSVPVTIN